MLTKPEGSKKMIMKVALHWSNKVPVTQFSREFLQNMLNRVALGYYRYGRQDRKGGEPKLWVDRALREIYAYVDTGNAEHLINTANYMMCEWINPEHRKHHFRKEVGSVTRGKV